MLGSPVDHSRAIVAGESRTGRPERVSLVSDETPVLAVPP
jgi:hypothetical protein